MKTTSSGEASLPSASNQRQALLDRVTWCLNQPANNQRKYRGEGCHGGQRKTFYTKSLDTVTTCKINHPLTCYPVRWPKENRGHVIIIKTCLCITRFIWISVSVSQLFLIKIRCPHNTVYLFTFFDWSFLVYTTLLHTLSLHVTMYYITNKAHTNISYNTIEGREMQYFIDIFVSIVQLYL